MKELTDKERNIVQQAYYEANQNRVHEFHIVGEWLDTFLSIHNISLNVLRRMLNKAGNKTKLENCGDHDVLWFKRKGQKWGQWSVDGKLIEVLY